MGEREGPPLLPMSVGGGGLSVPFTLRHVQPSGLCFFRLPHPSLHRHVALTLIIMTGESICVTVKVGSGNNKGKVFKVDPVYVCPTKVDKTNWLGGHTYGDTFKITQTKDGVSAVRTDTGNTNAGWGMDLQFRCCKGEARDCFQADSHTNPWIPRCIAVSPTDYRPGCVPPSLRHASSIHPSVYLPPSLHTYLSPSLPA